MLSKSEIQSFIKTSILEDESIEISDSQDLLLSGILDSINVMRLVSHIETKCNIKIDAADVVLENFGSIDKMESYLLTRA